MYNYCIETNGSTEMGKEFDSSAYEGASDYAWHMMQYDHLTETDALMCAAKHYKISYKDLQEFWDRP
jgi:hypothetical protein